MTELHLSQISSDRLFIRWLHNFACPRLNYPLHQSILFVIWQFDCSWRYMLIFIAKSLKSISIELRKLLIRFILFQNRLLKTFTNTCHIFHSILHFFNILLIQILFRIPLYWFLHVLINFFTESFRGLVFIMLFP